MVSVGTLVGGRSPDSILEDIDSAVLQFLCLKEVGRPQ